MLNHTYTSVKNANLVDSGNKQHIASQPSPLLKDNFLGEFRTELDKKKVLANLGIATDLSLEWEYIKGDIGRSKALMDELDSRTKYISKIDGFTKTLLEGIQYLETIVGGEQEGEDEQNERLKQLEETFQQLVEGLEQLNKYLKETLEIDIDELERNLEAVTEQVANINDLIQISSKADNALVLIPENSEQLAEGETPGLYVPNLEPRVKAAEDRFTPIETTVQDIQNELSNFVTKEDLGGDSFDFVESSEFNQYTSATDQSISNIRAELQKTVKTGEDGHVDTLYVNTISKNNNNDNIRITDSFEVTEGIPLDIRFVVDTLDDLLALPAKVCYYGMGVIVNSLSALYILRKSEERLNQEYISNVYNWKCPEDLVTVALSRTDYDALEEKNPNVFYYVFEEEITRTSEPKPEEFESTQEYEQAFQQWVESLKVLSQEYMSASWGVDIESKLSKKANQVSVNALNDSIKSLQDQITNISGGDSETSLGQLVLRVAETEADLQYLLGTDPTEGEEGEGEEPTAKGKIFEIEESVSILDQKVTQDYVTKESITTESDETNYIFVKKADYAKDTQDRADALSREITTEKVNTNQVVTPNISLSDLPLTSDGTSLLIDEKPVAILENVPKLQYLTQQQYDEKVKNGDIDENTYYYTTNEESYVTASGLKEKTDTINESISGINGAIASLQTAITSIENSIKALSESIESINSRLSVLEGSSITEPEPEPEPTPDPDSDN